MSTVFNRLDWHLHSFANGKKKKKVFPEELTWIVLLQRYLTQTTMFFSPSKKKSAYVKVMNSSVVKKVTKTCNSSTLDRFSASDVVNLGSSFFSPYGTYLYDYFHCVQESHLYFFPRVLFVIKAWGLWASLWSSLLSPLVILHFILSHIFP